MRDQPRAAAEGQIRPQPVDRDGNAVPEIDQEENVHEAPEEPGDRAPEFYPAKIGNRFAPANGRKISLIDVTEGVGVFARAAKPRGDLLCYISALLLRRRRNAGHR